MAGWIVEALGEQGAEAMEVLPLGWQFAQGAAEALAGEIGTAVGVGDHEAAQLHDELEAVGAGDGVPADPFIAILEAFGRAGPTEDGDEAVCAAFRVALPCTLPENMAGRASSSEIVMLFEQLAQLADFEWFGGGADNRRECRLHCRMGLCGVHGTATMQNQAGLSSQNCTITNLQAPLGCGPIALHTMIGDQPP